LVTLMMLFSAVVLGAVLELQFPLVVQAPAVVVVMVV